MGEGRGVILEFDVLLNRVIGRDPWSQDRQGYDHGAHDGTNNRDFVPPEGVEDEAFSSGLGHIQTPV